MSNSETRQRRQYVRARCTDDERQRIQAAADQAGFESLGEFLREKVLGPGQGTRGLPKADKVLLVRLLAEMGKIGSNVNQLARAVNAGGDTPHAATLRDVQADLAATFEAVRKALGRSRRPA